ncbi:MAG: hypothetical protein ACYC9Y_02905 [Candidatus Methylomirabilia bacterium]
MMRIPARPSCFDGKNRCIIAAVVAVSLAGCAAPRPPVPQAVSGEGLAHVRLMHRELAVPGARVVAVRNLDVALLEERIAARAGADGRAELALGPGIWYLSASAAEPPLFGWYGSNPVQIRAGETIEVTIPAVPVVASGSAVPAVLTAVSVTSAPPGEETVAGEVVGESGAVAGAGVSFYLDASTQFRGPGYLEARTDERGFFETRLSPGRYWLVARRRSGSQPFGPLEIGDDFGFYPGNPLEISSGESVAVRIPAVRVLKKSGWSGPSSLRTRVSGIVRAATGHPLAGYRAFLHAKPTMLGKPEFVSEPSGPDGSYLIWVDREGVYYLGARAEIGRAREERESIGLSTGAPDHAVEVRLGVGALPAMDIVVEGAP